MTLTIHWKMTLGYQSQTTYLPGRDLVLTVATNVETTSQAQPADFTCHCFPQVAICCYILQHFAHNDFHVKVPTSSGSR